LKEGEPITLVEKKGEEGESLFNYPAGKRTSSVKGVQTGEDRKNAFFQRRKEGGEKEDLIVRKEASIEGRGERRLIDEKEKKKKESAKEKGRRKRRSL